MSAFGELARTETLLFLRSPVSVFMAFLLPSFLLLMQAFLVPGTLDPIGGNDPGYASLRLIDLFVPIAMATALTSVSITNYPSAIAGYRADGILRRLDATPIGAHRVLLAQWLVSAMSLLGASTMTIALASLAFDAALPANFPLALLAFTVGALAMMSVGSLIAARAANTQVAYGIGVLVFMASLFTAGVWMPGPLMPESVREIATLTPLGAMAQTLTAAWYGGAIDSRPWIAMVIWSAVCALLSTKVFRWR